MMTNSIFNPFQAKLTGWFFIIAAISSIIGLKLYDPILNDNNFLISASDHQHQIILGAINELILALSATGTGLMLYPLLKRYNESIALGYLSFRLLEVVFIMIGTVSILTALAVSMQYTEHSIQDKDTAEGLMKTFISIHKWVFILGPNFMLAVNTFLYSYVFTQTKDIPTPLSKWGILAAFLIMGAAILELFGIIQQLSIWGILLALPIATYEMTLAIWLIRRKY